MEDFLDSRRVVALDRQPAARLVKKGFAKIAAHEKARREIQVNKVLVGLPSLPGPPDGGNNEQYTRPQDQRKRNEHQKPCNLSDFQAAHLGPNQRNLIISSMEKRLTCQIFSASEFTGLIAGRKRSLISVS